MPLTLQLKNSPADQIADSGVVTRPLAFMRGKLADRADHARTLSPVLVSGSIRCAELLMSTILGLAIAHLYVKETTVVGDPAYLFATTLVGTATILVFGLLDLYSLRALSASIKSLPAAMLGWTTAFATLIAAIFFLKIGEEISRVWLAVWFVAGAVAIMIGRIVAGSYVRNAANSGRLYQRVAIYGAGPLTENFIQDLEADSHSIVRIAGIYDDRKDARAPHQIAGYPRVGGLNDLITMSRTKQLDLVVVSLPLAAEDRLSSVAGRLSVLPADVKMPARATDLRFSPRTYSHVGSVAMIDLFDKPIADWDYVSKWLFDKVIGTLALIALAPLMLLVALAVKLDSRGPVFFRQKRYGFNNELIEVYKFRSMYIDACDATASKLVTKNDPRVTRVGAFLRKSSLDELPQLINVVKGNLSLVGPRPHALQAKAAGHLYDEVVDGYFARHKVKPGITGWAQINGWRGETDTEEQITKRIEHDLYYIENWSVFLDLYILLKTPFALLNTDRAY
jgi:Undecaprenyl-phosphate glucose phosphotransferase